MPAPVSTPFTQYSRLVTTRLRSRMHNQSFSNVFAEVERRKHPANRAVKAVLARVEDLEALKQEHRRGFDPTLKAKAVQQLQSLPLLSAEEDPHFTATLKALRVAAYFDAVHAPATFALLNHLTKHSYLLDGFHMHQIAQILLELRHPRTAEVLSVLLPRLREVAATDITATEACSILQVLSIHNVGQADEVLMDRLTSVMRHTVKDQSLSDTTRCVAALRCVPSTMQARPVLEAAETRLCELLEEGVLSLRVYVEEVFRVSAPPAAGAVPASASTKSRDAAVGDDDDIAGKERRRLREKENRQLLLANVRESRALVRELIRTCTWLKWGPRRVLNELGRAVIVYTDPSPRHGRIKREGDVDSDDAQGVTDIVFDEEERELEQLWRDVPRLARRDVAFFLKLLSASNYRYERVLLVLSSRIASMTAAADVTGDNETSAAANHRDPASTVAGLRDASTETDILSDLTTAVEALAFFYMTDATATVTALLKEIVSARESSASFAAPRQTLIVVDNLSRLFLSLARLRYPASLSCSAASSPSSPQNAVEACACVSQLLGDDSLPWFAGGSACVHHPLLAAQLASGIAQLTLSLSASKTSSTATGSSAATTRLLSQLLEGLRRSALGRAAPFPSAAASGPTSDGGSGSGRAETQHTVANAVASVKALGSSDARLCAALRDAEALSVKLL